MEISDFEVTENAESSDNFPDRLVLRVREAGAGDILFHLRLKQSMVSFRVSLLVFGSVWWLFEYYVPYIFLNQMEDL
jgi:hypothetical protein